MDLESLYLCILQEKYFFRKNFSKIKKECKKEYNMRYKELVLFFQSKNRKFGNEEYFSMVNVIFI